MRTVISSIGYASHPALGNRKRCDASRLLRCECSPYLLLLPTSGGGCQAGYTWSPTYCSCVASPILLTLGSNAFSLTSISGGVEFDLNGDGIRERVSWTAADNDDAFLWMDRNGNGIVDGGQELFGNVTPLSWTLSGPSASNGFEALGWFDLSANGGVPDGSIDSNDAVFLCCACGATPTMMA